MSGKASEKLAVCSTYLACDTGRRPQHEEENADLLGLVGSEMEYLKAQGFQIILLGDLNAWVGAEGRYGITGNRTGVNNNGMLLCDFLQVQNMDLVNKVPEAQGLFTRFPLNGVGLPTILDYICMETPMMNRVEHFAVDEDNMHEIKSDHRLLMLTLRLEHQVKKTAYVRWKPKFRLAEDKRRVFTTELDKELCEYEVFERKSPEAMYAELIRVIGKVGLMMAKRPAKRYSRRKPHKLKRLAKHRYAVMKRPHTEHELEVVKAEWQDEARAYKSRRAEQERRSNAERRRMRLMTEPTLANFWDFIKSGAAVETKITVMKQADGTTVFDKEQVKQVFYQEFKERWAASEVPVQQPPLIRSNSGKYGDELDQPITIEELNVVIGELKSGKAVGLDGVSPCIVKSMSENARKYILLFVNACIQSRRMPSALKDGRVKLLYKGDDKRIPKNYRPITVNSILSKLMTRLITIRLTTIVEREDILEDAQFGFRPQRSTQEAVIILNTVITQHKLDLRINMDRLKSDDLRRNLFICFVDLEKV